METDQPRYPMNQLDWLLDDLVMRVPCINQAVFLSQDGLALGASRGMSQADLEHLAALAAAFQSLARSASHHFGGAARQSIIEMTSGFFIVSATGQGTCLAVQATTEADIGQVAYEMAILVQRTGDHLQVNLRTQSALSGRLGAQALMPSNDEQWLDAKAGPVVRPYALTQGRTRPSGEAFDLVATVAATQVRITDPGGLSPEHFSVLQLARNPVTVVDVASDVDLPLGVVRILLGDLRELGLVTIEAPVPMRARQVDRNTLQEVLHGLRGL